MSDRRHQHRVLAIAAAVMLAGCGTPSAPPDLAVLAPELAAIAEASPSAVSLPELADAFAIGSRSTDVQREELERALAGQVVEWPISVHEVRRQDGWYVVRSQPVPIQSPEAMPLLHVLAYVVPRNARDEQTLMAVKTGDPLVLRGRVQGIRMRAVIEIGPAVVG
jgi:hypothetical protein